MIKISQYLNKPCALPLCPEMPQALIVFYSPKYSELSLIPSSQLTLDETKQAGNMKKISISTFLRNVEGICFPLCKNVSVTVTFITPIIF